MRILLLLVVLAVIGLTLARWLGQPPKPAPTPAEATTTAAPAVPAVPTRPQELKQFEQDLNRFLQDAATQRGRQADSP